MTIKDDDYKGAEFNLRQPKIDEYYHDRRELLKEYYQARGWNLESGYQSKEKLEELGLNEIAEELGKIDRLR
jgi:aldehyde:ferredoxin oxidoreductase